MSYSFISKTTSALGANGGTSNAIDTTGADLIIVTLGWFNILSPTLNLTDSKGNSWTQLTDFNGANSSVSRWYSKPTTVGSGHTFSVSGTNQFSSIAVSAFSGSSSSPFESETGASITSGTSKATGSLTPAENNCLVFAGIGLESGTGITIDSGLTSQTTDYVGGDHIGVADGYIIQTSATPINPTWSWTTTATGGGAALAVFKPAGAAVVTGAMFAFF